MTDKWAALHDGAIVRDIRRMMSDVNDIDKLYDSLLSYDRVMGERSDTLPDWLSDDSVSLQYGVEEIEEFKRKHLESQRKSTSEFIGASMGLRDDSVSLRYGGDQLWG